MNNLEKNEATKFSKVLRAARKIKAVGQQELAAKLGVSQSLLSKMENGIIIPSAPVWFYTCKFLEVDSNSGIKGFIDRRRDAVISNIDHMGTFKIPERYAYSQGSMTRTSRPLLAYFTGRYGEKKMNEYLKNKKIDPDFFVTLDLPLNINFNLDLLRAMMHVGALKKKDIPELVGFLKSSSIHGDLSEDYENQKDAKSLLETFEKNILKYDANWQYTFHLDKKDKFEIECSPQPHLKEFNLETDSMGEFILEYRKQFLKNFLSEHKVKVKNIDGIETVHKDKTKCVYQINIAN